MGMQEPTAGAGTTTAIVSSRISNMLITKFADDTPSWQFQGSCVSSDIDFLAPAQADAAAALCKGCPVSKKCSAEATTKDVSVGVWAAMEMRN